MAYGVWTEELVELSTAELADAFELCVECCLPVLAVAILEDFSHVVNRAVAQKRKGVCECCLSGSDYMLDILDEWFFFTLSASTT